nr:hypothetical protein predicted by Glimmer/Critica [Neisseria meningitidis alpha153]
MIRMNDKHDLVMTHVISLWMVKTAFCHAKAEGKVQRAGIILGFADGIKDLVRKICIPPKISVSDGIQMFWLPSQRSASKAA